MKIVSEKKNIKSK